MVQKALNKKEKKRIQKEIVFELSLLLSCYGYLHHNYTRAKESKEKPSNESEMEMKVVEVFLGRLRETIIPYKDLHAIAIRKNNSILNLVESTNINSFLFGLALLSKHLEMKHPHVDTKHLCEDLLVLEDFAIEKLEDEVVCRTFDCADSFFGILMIKLKR